jgi:hypothetical protein
VRRARSGISQSARRRFFKVGRWQSPIVFPELHGQGIVHCTSARLAASHSCSGTAVLALARLSAAKIA